MNKNVPLGPSAGKSFEAETKHIQLLDDLDKIIQLAKSKQSEELVKKMDAEINKRGKEIIKLKKKIEEYKKALQWCSGSADFGKGGQAHEGWKKIEYLLK